MKQTAIQQITPEAFFSLPECKTISESDGFAETRMIIDNAFLHYKKKFDTMVENAEMPDPNSADYEMASLLAHLHVTLDLIEGLPSYKIGVLDDPQILFHLHQTPTSPERVEKPLLESYSPLRHLDPGNDAIKDRMDAPPLFFRKESYLELPQVVSISELSKASSGFDYYLRKDELKEVIGATEAVYWENEFNTIPELKDLPIALTFLSSPAVQNHLGDNYNFLSN